ncbi:MAG: squalene synthase HpnC [Vicinamibacterales bacterium]
MNELREAYAACEALAKSHYENFPVASTLMPAHLRPHVAAVYAFARTADDFADEPGYEKHQRLRLLADWRARLRALTPDNNALPDRTAFPDTYSLADQIFAALADTIDRFKLPVQLFDDLLDAFSQDVTTTRYSTWTDVLDYCRRSANPVGRLVLRLSGYNSDALDRASDAVCTALQLTNFWQDLAIDWERGRLYVPEEIWRGHNADPSSLNKKQMTPEWAAALRDCGDRTRSLFHEGRPVCNGVSGRLRYELRATWLGGTRILDRLDRSGFDVFTARPKLKTADALVIAFGTLLWRETPPSPIRS